MMSPNYQLRVVFVIQGEGRGHMTQALALSEMLRRRGHRVSAALVGSSGRRAIPEFVREGLGVPIIPFSSPNFVSDEEGRIRLGRTITDNLFSSPRFTPSSDVISKAIVKYEPDVIINFYEGLFGMYAMLRWPGIPIVAVGHQFMFEHPRYEFGPGQVVDRTAVRLYIRAAGGGADLRLALSFYEAPDLPESRLRVVPPLLRQGVREREVTLDGSLLVYLLEPRMAQELVAWSERNPNQEIHCFTDHKPSTPENTALHFHPLSGSRFLDRMARCSGVVCTAGFESISEAMWMGKPALMVPVAGHVEQRANARDAERSGAGIAAETLDLDRLLAYLRLHRSNAAFRQWTASAEERVIDAIEEVAGVPLAAGDGAVARPASSADRPRVREIA